MSHPFTVRPVNELPLPISSHLFWYCTDCREVFRVAPFDDAPQDTVQAGEELNRVDSTLGEEPGNERERFLHCHRGHRLGILKKVKDKILSDRPVWDPMRTVYEEVSDGQEIFLLKSWREDISGPRCYLLLEGSLVVEEVSVSLEEELVRRALRCSFAFPAATLDHLMAIIQKTVAALSPEDLIPAYSLGTDPNVDFAYLSDRHLDLLLRNCLPLVDEEGNASLRRFFLTRHYNEELTLTVRQQLRLCFT
jgi:hypothetical protein